MLVIYEHGPQTAQEVLQRLPEPPSYSAVRTMLRVLEEKGQLSHSQDGPRYVYAAVQPREQASQGALKQMVRTFFDNSTEDAMAALLDMQGGHLSGDALDRLERIIHQARREGR